MIIKRRYPAFFTGFEETEHEVSTKEDVLNINWIKDIQKVPGHYGIFYSPSGLKDSPDVLMTLNDNGTSTKRIYFAVGYIIGGKGSDLGLEDYLEHINK